MSKQIGIRNNFTGEVEFTDAPDYSQYPVKEGQIVLWYADANPKGHPRPAIVQRVGEKALAVMVIAADMFGQFPEGVRSIHDPELDKLPVSAKACGAWDFTAEYKDHQKLLERVAALEEAITANA